MNRIKPLEDSFSQMTLKKRNRFIFFHYFLIKKCKLVSNIFIFSFSVQVYFPFGSILELFVQPGSIQQPNG